jgi:SNF2 family DNA or RNA helicase
MIFRRSPVLIASGSRERCFDLACARLSICSLPIVGRKHQVLIFRFLSRDTVEERMISRAKEKLCMTHMVVQQTKDQLSKDELDDILRFGAERIFKEASLMGYAV